MVKVKYKILNDKLPSQTSVARASSRLTIRPYECRIMPLGISVNIPEGYRLCLIGSTKLTSEKGISVAGGIKYFEPNYNDELNVILHNSTPYSKVIEEMEPIGELIIQKIPQIEWEIDTE